MSHYGPPGWPSYSDATTVTTTNTITIPTVWTTNTTTTSLPYVNIPMLHSATYYPYPLGTAGINPCGEISIDRFGTPSYTDLTEGIRPGTEWFSMGTMRLKNSLFMWGKDEKNHTMHLPGSIFVYLGVTEDFEAAKERHWFLTDSGQIVQYWGWVYDLSWRGHIKKMFEVVEETK